MQIIGNKPGEFQERLTISQLEAKHNLIFLSIPYNYIANKSVQVYCFRD